jgi:hypothetical protein
MAQPNGDLMPVDLLQATADGNVFERLWNAEL